MNHTDDKSGVVWAIMTDTEINVATAAENKLVYDP